MFLKESEKDLLSNTICWLVSFDGGTEAIAIQRYD